MPRMPIQARRGFYYKPNRNIAAVLPFDWNLVDTELGPMVEPRLLLRYIEGKVLDQDYVDQAFDSMTTMDDNGTGFYTAYGTAGQVLPGDFFY